MTDMALAKKSYTMPHDVVEEAVALIHEAAEPRLADDFMQYCEKAARAIEAEGAAYLAKAKAFDERCIALASTIRDVADHHAAELQNAAAKAERVATGLEALMDEFHNGS